MTRTSNDELWVMTADRVADGTGRAARPGTYVGVRGDRIVETGPVAALTGRPEARRLEFPGCRRGGHGLAAHRWIRTVT